MTDPHVFSQRGPAGRFYAVLVLLAIFPVMGIGSCMKVTPTIALIPLAVILLTSLTLHLGLREEHRLGLGPDAVRLTVRDVTFGAAKAERLLWESPLAELTAAKEVITRTPSSRGGWNTGSAVHFAGEHVLSEHMLGFKRPNSEYTRLLAVLRERLGDRFVVEQRT